MEESFKLKVNNEFEYDLNKESIEELDIQVVNANSYHILRDSLPFHTEVVQADFQNKKYTIRVNSGTYDVSISDHLDLLIDKMGFALSSTRDVGMIEAPMPGLILDINVRIGQAVNEDDPLVILEAMKMENVITSPRDGIIKNISVKKGQAVDKKHVLIEFE